MLHEGPFWWVRLALSIVIGAISAAGNAVAQGVPLRMQAVDRYLLDEQFEIALARSAAPEHVTEDATMLVLRNDGYHAVETGTNGFVCLVERSWSSPIGEHGDFFNPRLRAPICYSTEAARTTLAEYLLRTKLALEGKSIADIRGGVARAIASGQIPAPTGLAMSYMMSGGQRLGTDVGRFVPHVMFYIPYATNERIAHLPGTECHVCMFEHEGGPMAALIVPVPEFIEPPEEPVGTTRP